MKTFLLILFISMSYVTFSQSKNQQRIEQINVEINKAVEESNFEKASKLKKEKETRIKIEEAIKNGDFERAEMLKNSINNGLEDKPQPKSNPEPEPIVIPKENTTFKGDSYHLNQSIKRGFYMDLNVGGGRIATTYGGGMGTALGIDLGVNTGKYDYHKKYRLMFSLEFASFSAIFGKKISLHDPDYTPEVYYDYLTDTYKTKKDQFQESHYVILVGLAKPGVAFGFALNQNTGIEASIHLGAQLSYFPLGSSDRGGLGIEVDPRFMFRYKKLGIGLEFVYSYFSDVFSDHNNGWGSSFRITPTIGLKF